MSPSLDFLPREMLIAKAYPPFKTSILEGGICIINQLHSEPPLDAEGKFTFQEFTQANNQRPM